MNNLRWIDEYVKGTIDYCNSKDIYEIYSTLGIRITRVNKENYLLQENEALYIRSYFNGEIVFIRDVLDYKYEKFVLAHELAHAILHTELYTAAFNKRLLNKGKFERQASYFALSLLDIEMDNVNFEGYTIEQISRTLHVSEGSLVYFCDQE